MIDRKRYSIFEYFIYVNMSKCFELKYLDTHSCPSPWQKNKPENLVKHGICFCELKVIQNS